MAANFALPVHNKLLAALPGKEYKRLVPHLEPVTLELMTILHESGELIKYAYFPSDGLISLLAPMADGRAREVGLIGSEGMLGVAALMGVRTTATRAIVQLPGTGVRIKAKALLDEFRRGGALQDLTLRYTHALFSQVSQSTACISSHKINERLCRWLLMTHDGAPGDVFPMTHQFMSVMLGVTRVGVTNAAGILQREGMIRYSRGKVTVVNRRRLELAACECYGIVKKEYNRVLG